MKEVPYFPEMEKNGWETDSENFQKTSELEFSKIGDHDVRLSIIIPYENDNRAYECISDLSDNYWEEFYIPECVEAMRTNGAYEVRMIPGGAVRLDFSDSDLHPYDSVIMSDTVQQTIDLTAEIDKGLNILRRETAPAVGRSKTKELKADLDETLLIQELKDKHGWSIETKAGDGFVSVDMSKQGPFDSRMSVSFSVSDLNDDEFYRLYECLRDICFYPGDNDERDKCVLAAVRGEKYEKQGEISGSGPVSFSLDFTDSREKIDGFSLDAIVSEVNDAGAEVSTVDDCLFGEQYDRPEMSEIEDFLNENDIPFVRESDIEFCQNKLTVDDDNSGLHFTVSTGMDGDDFTLEGGLQFDEKEFDKRRCNFVSPEELIDRLKAVEYRAGEYEVSHDLSLNVYAFVSDGEDDYAVIGPNRNDAVPCMLEQDGNGDSGYSYGNIFVPVSEIRNIPVVGRGYIEHEQAAVQNDAEPGRMQNARSGVIGSRLDKMDRLKERDLKTDEKRSVQDIKNHNEPEGRG